MEILRGLGVDGTIGYQLVLFLLTYLVLHFVLFNPYFKAFKERVNRTMGRAELAEKYLAETNLLQSEYETKARTLSSQYKSIYDESRAKAMSEYDKLVSEARQKAKDQTEKNKADIAAEFARAHEQMQKEIPSIAGAVTARLLGKDLIQ